MNREEKAKKFRDWSDYYWKLYEKTSDEKYLKKHRTYRIKFIQFEHGYNYAEAEEILEDFERHKAWEEKCYGQTTKRKIKKS